VKIAVRSFLAVLCLLCAGMWGYYLFLAPEQGIYQLQDTTWPERAKPICVAAQSERRALADIGEGYIANPTPEQMAERADIVEQATVILEQMLDDIVALPVDNDRDRQLIAIFEENYRIVLDDRRRYLGELRKGNLVPYTETVVGGGPVSNVVLDFTAGVKGNEVPECSPPGELGGDIRT
jgi:hypothetical protein